MMHYVFYEGKQNYIWEFNTFKQSMRVTELLAKQASKTKSCVYYQRLERSPHGTST